MPKTATSSVEIEPLDRLEEKVKLLVNMIDRMKSEQARVADENQRLTRETKRSNGCSIASSWPEAHPAPRTSHPAPRILSASGIAVRADERMPAQLSARTR